MSNVLFSLDETALIYRLLNSSEQQMLSALPGAAAPESSAIRENLALLSSARDKIRVLLVDNGCDPADLYQLDEERISLQPLR